MSSDSIGVARRRGAAWAVFAAALLAVAAVAAAQPAEEGPAAGDRAGGPQEDNPLQRIGGPVAVVILAVSVILVALVIEHAVVLRTSVLCPQELFIELEDLLRAGRVVRAMELLSDDGSPLARVAEAGLSACGEPEATVEAALNDAGNQQTLRLHQKISYLNLIAAISPMLGLLGTVLGMIGAFASFTEGASKADLGPNISNALLTTFEGLTVAIPALVAHTYFRNRVNLAMLSLADQGKRIKGLVLALPADAVASLRREQRLAEQGAQQRPRETY
jgi:biopolymer transport protein ExbB